MLNKCIERLSSNYIESHTKKLSQNYVYPKNWNEIFCWAFFLIQQWGWCFVNSLHLFDVVHYRPHQCIELPLRLSKTNIHCYFIINVKWMKGLIFVPQLIMSPIIAYKTMYVYLLELTWINNFLTHHTFLFVGAIMCLFYQYNCQLKKWKKNVQLLFILY
jgi:hypothetical protein